MNKKKIIIDEILEKSNNILDNNINSNKYGTFTIIIKGQIIKGDITKDISIESSFKETIKL